MTDFYRVQIIGVSGYHAEDVIDRLMVEKPGFIFKEDATIEDRISELIDMVNATLETGLRDLQDQINTSGPLVIYVPQMLPETSSALSHLCADINYFVIFDSETILPVRIERSGRDFMERRERTRILSHSGWHPQPPESTKNPAGFILSRIN